MDYVPQTSSVSLIFSNKEVEKLKNVVNLKQN